MALTDPWPVNANVVDAKELRLALTALVLSPGVVPYSKPGDTSPMPGLIYTSSSMTPVVRDFSLITARANSGGFATDGFSLARQSGTGSVPAFPTAPATGSRIDTFVTRANDTLQGDASATPQLLIRSGQATTGTPVAPTLSAGDTEIAQVLIPAGATALNSSGVVITHTYRAASLVGAPRFVRNATERAALLSDTQYPLSPGQEVYQLDNGYRYEARLNNAGNAMKLYRLTPGTAHFTRTTTFSMANAALSSIGTSNTRGSSDKNSDFVTASDTAKGIFVFSEEGHYVLTMTLGLATRPNNTRTFIELDDGVDNSVILGRTSTRDEGTITLTLTVYVPEGGRTVNMNGYQSTGAANNGTSDVYIERVG